MKEFTLSKTGGTAKIDILRDSDMDQVWALHGAVRASLPESQRDALLPQSETYYRNLLTHTTGLMVGVRVDSALAAMMALTEPMALREAIGLHMLGASGVFFHHASLDDMVSVFDAPLTNPVWSDGNLEKNLLSFAVWLPYAQSADHVFAQVPAGLTLGWGPLMRQKFGVVAAANDPENDVPQFILQKPSFGFDLEPCPMADEVDPVSDFSAIARLTQKQALIGVLESEGAARLSFMRNREEASLMPVMARVGRRRSA